MIRAAALAAVLVLAGCDPKYPDPGSQASQYSARGIKIWHDEKHSVTCWLSGTLGSNGGQSISCLPDWMLASPEARQ